MCGFAVALLLDKCAVAPLTLAANAAAGRQKVVACAVCHGPLGPFQSRRTRRPLPGNQRCIGQSNCTPSGYGTRTHEVTSLTTKPLTDADKLAVWVTSLKISVESVP